MFTKFSNLIHSAVESIAPKPVHHQDFMNHWKEVTQYFIQNKVHRVSVEQTNIPSHLNYMLDNLVYEEDSYPDGGTGPALEYLLQHRILETLYTLARTDCPPGMKQIVLKFFTRLLSRIKQPLLPHINVYKAVTRLVKVCGETKAAPSEAEEIQFLCLICAKVRTQPYLVNLFIETPIESTSTEEKNKAENSLNFPLINCLLNLLKSPDARVAVKSCEGLMMCSTLPELKCSDCIVNHTPFCDDLTQSLIDLYKALPKTMDPRDIDGVEAKWGLDILCSSEDTLNFPGKRALVSYLSWLDYCDQLISAAQDTVATELASKICKKFLEPIIGPALLQTYETGAVTAMAYLSRSLKLITSKKLLQEYIVFILGNNTSLERKHDEKPKIRDRLIKRCNHISDEMSITSLRIFETLLLKGNKNVIHNLVLSNLLGRSYLIEDDSLNQKIESTTYSTHATGYSSSLDESREELDKVKPSSSNVNVSSCDDFNNNFSDRSNKFKSSTEDISEVASNNNIDNIVDDTNGCSDGSEMYENVEGVMAADVLTSKEYLDNDSNTKHGKSSNKTNIHSIIKHFLNLLPDDAKSSYSADDSGYDSYLRDAHRQFSDISLTVSKFGWANEPLNLSENQSVTFYEGSFLNMLCYKITKLMDQTYDVNLQVTAVISQLALLPHPNLHEYLLNPFLPFKEEVSTISSCIKKVVNDLEKYIKDTPNFQNKLIGVRKQLMGVADNFRRTKIPVDHITESDTAVLESIILLEEFCKELAAIAFVKYHTVSS